MIFLVDDDASITDMGKAALTEAGHEVLAFSGAEAALNKAADAEPELIISDVMMPGMGGFEFKDAYSSRFPGRNTPFIFLSSMSDAAMIVKGLDMGADDYLTKPINPEVLKAKVRSLLGRKKRYSVPIFHGDLSKLPFVKLLQFCEMKGLTGEIDITSGGSFAKIQVKGGNIQLEGLDDTLLGKLYDESEGTFTICSYPVDFREIEEAAAKRVETSSAQTPQQAIPEKEKPMGRLSGVRANNLLFQLQTEFITYPENSILTIVIHEGKVMMKKAMPVPGDKTDRRELEKMIEEQHVSVEADVREKVNVLIKKKTEGKESPKEKYLRLFEAGFDKYREGSYEEALAIWQEAYTINPTDKVLETNLRILKKKLKME